MRLPTTAVLFALLVMSRPCRADLLIENVTVLTGERPEVLPGRYVLVRGERIVSVSVELPTSADGAVRVDGRGKFLTPGLMDSHVHVSDVPGVGPFRGDAALDRLHDEYERQQPRSYLYFGVTQLVDPANLPEAIHTFQAQPVHPDLFRCGAAPVLNGYPTVFIPAPLRYEVMSDYLFEPANHDLLPAGADPAAHTPEAVVARIAASGALCVKLFIEDGFGAATGWPMPSVETIHRTVKAAHRRGLIVLAHANALDTQRIAVAGRVDVIAHGLWNWTEVEDTGGMPTPIADHLRAIHALQIGWQPTLRVIAGVRALFVADTLNDPIYAKVVPSALLAWYRTEPAQWYKKSVRASNGDASDAEIARRRWGVELRGMRATRFLSELGRPLLLASDTPPEPTYGSQPGYDTYRELQLMAQAGVPLTKIFAAATTNNARQFHLDRDYGSVQAGKLANLLLLDANPLSSVEAWSQIDKIILRGRLLDRASLAADAHP